uniref:NADH-ubiquinone oxidoreductase chain 5 n=1 Tax=Orbinia latreillii TaxID=195264 RepID=Q1X8Y5_9ANNE|nr:NADH dehydrogenase subunit 5 [Orbinia latreillii]AAX50146.1 NADH dehydrogenase subunit 5 [Orbinia latreillii]
MTPSIATYLLWSLWLIATPLALTCTSTILLEWSLVQISTSPIYLPLIIDQTGMLFCSAVLFISANVMNFAKSYMQDDKALSRFTYLVLLFVLSMNLLIFIPHLIALLIGWDGLGLVSFLLVIYYQNPKSLGAGMITVLSNRIGDAFLLLSIGWSLNQGHWTIISMWDTHMNSLLSMAIMIAAMTKSAQLPFSSWLPAAMAAPTPVSALVHSSTLVTAGVFLLIRFAPFLNKTSWFCPTLLLIASMTMLMAGYSAMGECDMKKIIALSTLSQLGVMMASLGMGNQKLALFHLLTHAMFKALLFICAGTIIHTHHHTQDLRHMGNTWNQMPLTTSCLMIANLALCGSPFLSGFYSKDLIIESALFYPHNSLIILMFIVATALTTAYSIRFMLSVLWSPVQNQPMLYTHDTDLNCSIPMVLLTLKAITLGCILNWSLISPISHPTLPIMWKLMPILVGLLATFLVWMTQAPNITSEAKMISTQTIHFNMTSMWQMVPISTQSISTPFYALSNTSTKLNDHGWFELLGPQGTYKMITRTGSHIQSLQALPLTSFIMVLFVTTLVILLLTY